MYQNAKTLYQNAKTLTGLCHVRLDFAKLIANQVHTKRRPAIIDRAPFTNYLYIRPFYKIQPDLLKFARRHIGYYDVLLVMTASFF
jgi:hypothetical protein